MKKNLVYLLAVAVIIAVFSGCCTTRNVEYKTKIYKPVYKNLDEIRSGVKSTAPKVLKNTGKIYVYGNYIFVNERKEGIHIIDNSNPSAPLITAFIQIPGNGDMAVKNNILYADSYIDLVALDITNPSQPALVKRIENIFPNLLDVNGIGYFDPEKGLLVDYIEKDTVIKYSYRDCGGDNVTTPENVGMEDNSYGGEKNDASSNSGNTNGKGGSMARFTIFKNFLYSVDGTSLQAFDITTPNNPKVWLKMNIGWNIETIYPFKDKLFIGSTTGMFIYDVSSSWNPVQVGQFQHTRACDPVVADDNYAYVTLRSGTSCGGFSNQLDIVDIRDISNPKLIKSYPMQQPAGLGLDKNILFICDGPAGLKVFDVTKPLDIQLTNWQSDIKTFDVIPLGSSLLMIGEDGFYQYDYSDPKNLKLLSKIPVSKIK